MTDRERAEAVVRGNLDILDAVSAREIAADIEEALTAVRLDERRLMLEYLRKHVIAYRLGIVTDAELLDRIAHGRHAEAGS